MALKNIMVFILALNAALLSAEALPDWFAPLRDAVYGGVDDAASIKRIGGAVEERAKMELSGVELYNTLSYCKFLIAKAYQNESNYDKSLLNFQRGLDYANMSVKINPTSEGYRMMAENISQLCTLNSTAWVIANGLKVETYAKKGLEYDKRNAACGYLIAARWIYAPAPFNNVKKGINQMEQILSGPYDLQKDDWFNIYYSIAYGYNLIKQPDKTKLWLEKSLSVYPENKDALELKHGKARIAVDISSVDGR
jgi:tetratricopeptide (TPR) repeat protein